MDNAAFKSLISKSPADGNRSNNAFKKPAALGSRARSSIPMTPRNVPGYNNNREFARQVAEQSSSNEPPLKKFKSSAAPKGSKLGKGYTDRAQARKGQDEEENSNDDKATRLKNLEEQFKLGQIDQATFENLREQIGVGGDVSSTHLVKGLDWKLLAKARRGEDLDQPASTEEESEQQPDADVDDELERALEKEVVAQINDAEGDEAPATAEAQQVLSRDEILRAFREQRNRPAQPAAPVLNERFKKVTPTDKSGKKKFIESINGRRREVLVITNKDGTTKRKTRWIDPEDATRPEQQPLGMEVPAALAAKHKAMLEAEAAADDNEDIFADAGDDYNPLADIESDDEPEKPKDNVVEQVEAATEGESVTKQKRNYFMMDDTGNEQDQSIENPVTNDPTILAALKRAAQIRQREEESEANSTDRAGTESEAKSSAFLAKLKEHERQDAADLDYGFGESRFGDDDEDNDDVELHYDDEEGGKKKGAPRKRGPKKRKGNKDSVQDVMGVLEGRNKKS